MPESVLIVDDSSTIRAFVRAALEQMGVREIAEAASGFDALRLIPRQHFDLLIVDVNMPDINGLELVSVVRKKEEYDGTPIVIISTEASERDRERGLSLGANAYLGKPFEASQLRAVIERVCVTTAK